MSLLALAGIASIVSGADEVKLYDVPGDCKQGMRAEYIARDTILIPGCYMYFMDKVWISFADGDALVLKVDAFKWKPGMKPAGA